MKIFAAIMATMAMFFAIWIAATPDALAFPTLLVSPAAITFVAVVGTVISQEPLIYRDGIPPLLKETLGIRLGKSTIAKLFSPAIGQGVEPACYWGRRPLYRPADVIAWAKSRLRPGHRIMSISTEEMPADHIPARGADEPAASTNHQRVVT
jgi:hypothetical protein